MVNDKKAFSYVYQFAGQLKIQSHQIIYHRRMILEWNHLLYFEKIQIILDAFYSTTNWFCRTKIPYFLFSTDMWWDAKYKPSNRSERWSKGIMTTFQTYLIFNTKTFMFITFIYGNVKKCIPVYLDIDCVENK